MSSIERHSTHEAKEQEVSHDDHGHHTPSLARLKAIRTEGPHPHPHPQAPPPPKFESSQTPSPYVPLDPLISQDLELLTKLSMLHQPQNAPASVTVFTSELARFLKSILDPDSFPSTTHASPTPIQNQPTRPAIPTQSAHDNTPLAVMSTTAVEAPDSSSSASSHGESSHNSILQILASRGIGGEIETMPLVTDKQSHVNLPEAKDDVEADDDKDLYINSRTLSDISSSTAREISQREYVLVLSPTAAVPGTSSSTDESSAKSQLIDNCLLLTSRRLIEFHASNIQKEILYGPSSGHILSRDTPTMSKHQDSVIHLIATKLKHAHLGQPVPSVDASGMIERSALTISAPSAEVGHFFEEYLMYSQSLASLRNTAMVLNHARRMQSSDSFQRMRSDAWASFLKAISGPIVLDPSRVEIYRNAINESLAKLASQQQEHFSELKLTLQEFRLPALKSEQDAGELPALSMLSVDTTGDGDTPVYTFDVSWACPSFCIRVKIEGKKLMIPFSAEVEVSGIEVTGQIKIRASSWNGRKLAVRFDTMPHLAFGLGTVMALGDMELPFQKTIEKLVAGGIRKAIRGQLQEKLMGMDKWLPIQPPEAKEGSPDELSSVLSEYNSVKDYPFKFDGTDDEATMSNALNTISRTETKLQEFLFKLKEKSVKLEQALEKQRLERAQQSQ